MTDVLMQIVLVCGVRSTWGAMAHLYDTVISLITQPAEKRSDAEIEQILPWFRKKSDMFKHLHSEVLKDIIKNCEFTSCQRDSVIIRQGEKGDCFFIILTGTVSIHINTSLTDEEFANTRKRQLDEEALVLREGPDLHPLDRSKYGNYLGKIEAGKSFGELALISNDCVRNASIISTEVTDLLIVRKDLYNRSLRFHQAQAFEEKQKFVNSLPLFHSWQSRYKNMMAMSLKKEILKFEDVVVKQGAPVDGLIFIVSGQVKVVMDPSQHKTQYPHHFPKGAIADLEKEKARDLLRKEMNLEKKRGFDRKETYQKRSEVVHETKKQANKHLELCLMGAVDIIGDLEMVLGLQTYAETIICTEEARLFVLDQNNYDRLLEKRHPQSLNIMKDIVHNKLTLHFSRLSEQTLPLFRFFLYTLDEKEKKEKLRKAPIVQQERPPQIELSPDGIQKGPLINMYGPGSVFYLIRMRENKRRHRKIERSKYTDKLDFNKVQENQKASGRPPQIVEEEIPEEGVSPHHESQLAISLARNAMTDDMTDSFLTGVGEMYSQAEAEADYACSDSALSMLERRIQDWHNGFNEGTKGNKRTVKLHRYQAEDSKPRPGNKIVIRLKNKTNVAFTSFRKDEFDAQTEPADIKHSARFEINLPNINPSSDDETNNQEVFEDSNRLRPKTCPAGTRQRFRKRKDSKQYTREEYLDLKAELKRRQMAYKSFLPLQRSTTTV
ncbi:hypothetical protein LOTGIDRAFT_227784 [Lottia gigantea]|uniref:Cyclic nucleotide-binding domain-containing protein n=1 Tax=Lottia gigantea TaxID=225164 RepID=V4BGQ9_LOTGI|nr:hypothetical protein LOTGIDRAFT_227784 [Lottia gigantea]ESP05077.1 hypothetical protein LOTGIDRAFT_227784 [Lottia gigantea]